MKNGVSAFNDANTPKRLCSRRCQPGQFVGDTSGKAQVIQNGAMNNGSAALLRVDDSTLISSGTDLKYQRTPGAAVVLLRSSGMYQDSTCGLGFIFNR